MIVDSDNTYFLIVDDQEDHALGLKDLLEIHNPKYHVDTAFNIADALGLAKRKYFDIAILDIRLGQQNGLALLEKLKKDFPHIICIMLTAYRDAEYAARAVVGGAEDYLYKPINDVQFFSLIADYVEQAQSWNRLQKTHHVIDSLINDGDGTKLLIDRYGRLVDFSSSANKGPEGVTSKPENSSQKEFFWELPIFACNEAALKELFSEAKNNGSASRNEVALTEGRLCDLYVKKVQFQDGDLFTLDANVVGVSEYLQRRQNIDNAIL